MPWRSQRIFRYRYRQQYRQVTFFLKRAKAWRSLDPPTKQHRDILLPAACTQLSLGPSAHRVDVATLLLSRCNALLTRRPGGPDISRISPDAGRPESQFVTAIPCDGELRRANAAIHLFRPARELEHSAETSSTPSRQMPRVSCLPGKRRNHTRQLGAMGHGARACPACAPSTVCRRRRLELGQLAMQKSPVHQPLVTSHSRRAASLLRRSSSVVSPPSGSQPGGRIT